MNVIVAHEGKQHVNHLLIGLANRNWLRRFYVGFASNHLPTPLRRIRRLDHWLRKKQFVGFDPNLIRSMYISTLLSRLTTNHLGHVQTAFRLFDGWVANRLGRETECDVFIGYENCNRLSFRAVKRLGKITVLDLAHIHHDQSLDIRQQYIPALVNVAEVLAVNARKQAALAHTDYIFTLSNLATASLCAAGISRDRIYELALGVDTALFRPASRQQTTSTFTVLYVGTLHWMKGIDQLIRAFQALNLPDAQLLLVGPVGDAGALLTQCTGTIRHVPFLHHDDLVSYYQQADVFVFPSYLDSWGQVVLEAMACGTPVIVSDNTGAKDAVAKGGGFIVPTSDETALSDKIRHFYERRSEVGRLGREARLVAEHYTWDQYYQQLAESITDIARRENIPL